MPFLEGHLNDGFLKAKNNEKMNFYLMWANHNVNHSWDKRNADDAKTGKNTALIWQGGVDRDEFEKICHRFIEKYFSHPLYYRIDNKPVFMIYSLNELIGGLGGLEQTMDALEWFHKEVKKAGFEGLELQYSMRLDGQRDIIVDGETVGEEKQLIEKLGFNSLTHYVYAHMTGIDREYNEVVKDVEGMWNWISDNYSADYFPQVSVGWDASPRTYNFTGGIIKNNTPELFRKYLVKARAMTLKNPVNERIITINSWNEWGEGSYLEPDMIYGTEYLKAIKEVFKNKQSKGK